VGACEFSYFWSFDMSIIGNPCLWAASIGFAVAQPALAAAPISVFPTLRAPALPPVAGSEKVISTFVHNAYSGVTEAPETVAIIDTQEVTCPATAGTCTVVVLASVEASGGENTGNGWSVLPTADGSQMGGGAWTGELLPDGGYSSGFQYQSMSVPAGKHNLGVQIYSVHGAVMGYYQIQYAVYKP
jgi:hypothetical protein